MIIYKIQNNINGKVYIGQTQRSLDIRIAEHRKDANNGTGYYLHSAIRKYGWDNFTAVVIASTDNIDTLNELEQFYIQKYHSDIDGYNLAPGGYSNCMDSEIVKSKHDTSMKSLEVRAKISATMKARIAKYGVSDEHRKHVSEGLKKFYADGKRPNYKVPQHLTPEHYKALNDAKNKAVYCVDVDNNVVAEFDRVKDAADWWFTHGYGHIKSSDQLNDRIKESAKQDKYIKGLKWVYRV